MADFLPKTYNPPAAVTGDTYDGFSITGITIDGANPSNTLASVRLQFRTAPDATTAALELTSAAADITIDDSATWAITIEAFTISLAAGRYYYDIEFTDSAGLIRTYVAGSWRVDQDVTRT